MDMPVTSYPVVNTAEEFDDWLSDAKPKDICVYHTGYLAVDMKGNRKLIALAGRALRSAGYVRYGQGVSNYSYGYDPSSVYAHLVQKKSGPGCWLYMAIAI